jgi:hypothetical protein
MVDPKIRKLFSFCTLFPIHGQSANTLQLQVQVQERA